MTKFFTYSQNNSGGSFVHEPKEGIGYYVIIEADSASEANEKAEEIGLYFNGCKTGQDCGCCGDRWQKADDDEDYPVPSVYGRPCSEFFEDRHLGIGSYIHYKDGTIKRIPEAANAS